MQPPLELTQDLQSNHAARAAAVDREDAHGRARARALVLRAQDGRHARHAQLRLRVAPRAADREHADARRAHGDRRRAARGLHELVHVVPQDVGTHVRAEAQVAERAERERAELGAFVPLRLAARARRVLGLAPRLGERVVARRGQSRAFAARALAVGRRGLGGSVRAGGGGGDRGERRCRLLTPLLLLRRRWRRCAPRTVHRAARRVANHAELCHARALRGVRMRAPATWARPSAIVRTHDAR